MAPLYQALATYEGLIYIILAIFGLLALRRLWIAWREYQESIFGLEREVTQRRLLQASAGVVLVLLLAVTEFILAAFVVPNLPQTAFLPTATIDPLATPSMTLPPDLATAFALTPNPAAVPGANGCIPDQLEISSPRQGQTISGVIDLIGTVDIPNFGFYKYEVAPLGSDVWATISAGRQVVIDGSLGGWNTGQLTPGDYQLRLVVTDNQGRVLPACLIQVRVTGE